MEHVLDKVKIEQFLGEIRPKEFYSNGVTGSNNIESAKATTFDIYMHDESSYSRTWAKSLFDAIEDFN